MTHTPIERVILLSVFDYPTRFAHARHGFEMARAYHELFDGDFLFFVNTALEQLPVPTVQLFGRFGRRIKKMRLRKALLLPRLVWFFTRHPEWRGSDTLVMTTDPGLLWAVRFLKKRFGVSLGFENHGTLTASQIRALADMNTIICVTGGLMRELVDISPALESKVRIIPNAVDVALFGTVPDNKIALRTELGLPRDIFLVGYIGRFEPLGTDKGIRRMIDALQRLPDRVQVLLVGGAKKESDEMLAYAEEKGVAVRVRIIPFVSAPLVPRYAKACDVLAYIPERTHFTERETSPMKLFEYMAAERPIIISDTGAVREVVGDEDVWFIDPDSEDAYEATIRTLQKGADPARIQRAFKKVKGNTWRARAKRVVEFE